MCGCRFATSMLSKPVAPPTSHKVLNRLKSNFSEKASKLSRDKPGHPAKELLQPGRVGVELFEHSLVAVLNLILRLTGAQGFRQIVPEFEETCVQHLQDTTDVTRAVAVEIQCSERRVEIARRRSITFPFEELLATSASKKSLMARGWRPISLAS